MDGLDHRGIGRCAAINRAVLLMGDNLRLGSCQIGYLPRHVFRLYRRTLDLGAYIALATAQVIAKPRNHQRCRLELGKIINQIIH